MDQGLRTRATLFTESEYNIGSKPFNNDLVLPSKYIISSQFRRMVALCPRRFPICVPSISYLKSSFASPNSDILSLEGVHSDMSDFDVSQLEQLSEFITMDPLNAPDSEEQLSTYEDISATDPSAIEPFLVGDAASFLQAADIHEYWQPGEEGNFETDIDPAFSMQESQVNQCWQVGKEANMETSIDPSLLTPFDSSLDLLTSTCSLQTTSTPIFDPSTGAEWQLMDNNIETSTDPTIRNSFDAAIDLFAADLHTLDPSETDPFGTDPSPTNLPFAQEEFLFPSEYSASNFDTSFLTEDSYAPPPHYLPSTNPASKAWKTKTKQPPVDGSGCPCSLCKGGAVITPPSLIAAYKRETIAAAKATKKSNKEKKVVASNATGSRKRKAREAMPEESEDSSLEEESSEEEEEWYPRRKAGKEGTKRRRILRKAALPRKMPRGLEIDMQGW